LLLKFIHSLFGSKHQHEVVEVTTQTEILIQHYLIRLLIEALIIARLNSIGLIILGIDFALMLATIGALVNIIPYIGGLVAVALFMLMALATKSPVNALYVLAIYYFIQIIDNHYIVPMIVASKVKINALFSIIIVLAGNALWGIPGMFLSIPLLVIVKLIFDHIDPLKPWGFLLGDSLPNNKMNKLKL
jgi:predicted PurR-regulated permease PerM